MKKKSIQQYICVCKEQGRLTLIHNNNMNLQNMYTNLNFHNTINGNKRRTRTIKDEEEYYSVGANVIIAMSD